MRPEELKRTRSLHYSLFALKPLMAMAELARSEGIDLYGTREGQRVCKSLEAVAPAVLDQKQWHHKEIRQNAAAGSEALYALAAERFGTSTLRSTSATLQERAAHRPGTSRPASRDRWETAPRRASPSPT